jgi:O-antigen/teichoic acid export membrane protein
MRGMILSEPISKSLQAWQSAVLHIGRYFLSNTISAVISLGGTVAVTRLLAPEQMGLYATFAALCLCFGNAFNLEINTALKRVFADGCQTAGETVSCCFTFSTVLFLAVLALLTFGLGGDSSIFGRPYLSLYAIVVLAYARSQAINLHTFWKITNHSFLYSLWSVIASFLIWSLVIACLLYRPTWQMRVVADIVYAVLALGVALLIMRNYFALKLMWNRTIIASILSISMPLLPFAVTSYIYIIADRLILQHYHNSADTGLYTVALSFSSLVTIVYSALFPVFEASIFRKTRNNHRLHRKQLLHGMFLVIASYASIAFVSYWIVSCLWNLLAGEKYENARVFVLPCTLMVLFSSLTTVCASVFIAYQRNGMLSSILCSAQLASLFIIINIAPLTTAVNVAYMFGAFAALQFITILLTCLVISPRQAS